MKKLFIKFPFLIGISLFLILLTSCQSSNNIRYNELIVENYDIRKINENDQIETYLYSPDKQNYFLEVKFISPDEYIGPHPYINIYQKDKNHITGRLLLADWNSYQFRINNSIKIVEWINNDEAIINDKLSYKIYIYNIKTNEKTLLSSISKFPENINYSYNKQLNKLAVSAFYGDKFYYIFDIQEKSWNEIYQSTNHSLEPDTWVKSEWDKQNNIYFDAISDDKQKVIKKYNYNTGEITDYIKNSYILNTSPEKKYLAYVDKSKNLTVITNIEENINIEIPFSEELVWNNETQFASVENNKYINIYNIKNNVINIEKYDISNLLKESELIYNLQYINNNLRFDIIDFEFDEETYGSYVAEEINKVTTYEIKLN